MYFGFMFMLAACDTLRAIVKYLQLWLTVSWLCVTKTWRKWHSITITHQLTSWQIIWWQCFSCNLPYVFPFMRRWWWTAIVVLHTSAGMTKKTTCHSDTVANSYHSINDSHWAHSKHCVRFIIISIGHGHGRLTIMIRRARLDTQYNTQTHNVVDRVYILYSNRFA